MSSIRKSVKKKNPPVGLIFAENENDAESLKNLAHAIRGDLPRMEYCRKPLILMRDRQAAEARKKNARDVHQVRLAWGVDNDVKFVIAHQDCDDIEPAHTNLSTLVAKELLAVGVPDVIPVTPAWETEAWWFLWPTAVAAVNSKWKSLNRKSNHGMLANAKEVLRRDLRAVGARDYEESDSRKISLNVRTMGLIGCLVGTCGSYSDFRARVLQLQV